jgi:hypothetical protein
MLFQTENQNPKVYCCAYPRTLEYFSLMNGILENGNIRTCSAMLLAAFHIEERIAPEKMINVSLNNIKNS